MSITRETIKQAALNGTGLDHLTPGQVWAANKLDMAVEKLEAPLDKHIAWMLHSIEEDAVIEFFTGVAITDTDEIMGRVYDDRRPMFIRSPILKAITEGLEVTFPGLTVAAISEGGAPMYRAADLARSLGVSEQDVLDHAEKLGMGDGLITDHPPQVLH